MATSGRKRARAAVILVILAAAAGVFFLMWEGTRDAETDGRGAVPALAVSKAEGPGEAGAVARESVKARNSGVKRKKPVSLNIKPGPLLEMATVPEFTKEQIEAYLKRTGRSEKALVLAGILSPNGTYLEEAREVNPESKLCDAVDAAKLYDAARMGDAEALARLREKCGAGGNAEVYQEQLLQRICEDIRKGRAADPAMAQEISDLAATAREGVEPFFLEKSLREELADLMTTEGGLSGKRQLLTLDYWAPRGDSSDPIRALVDTARTLEERAGGGETRDAEAAKAAEGLALSAMAWIQASREKADNVFTKQSLVEQESALMKLGAGQRAVGPLITDMEAYMADLREERGEMGRLYEVNKNLAFKASDAQWEHFAEESKRLGYLEALKATENDEVYSDFFE